MRDHFLKLGRDFARDLLRVVSFVDLTQVDKLRILIVVLGQQGIDSLLRIFDRLNYDIPSLATSSTATSFRQRRVLRVVSGVLPEVDLRASLGHLWLVARLERLLLFHLQHVPFVMRHLTVLTVVNQICGHTRKITWRCHQLSSLPCMDSAESNDSARNWIRLVHLHGFIVGNETTADGTPDMEGLLTLLVASHCTSRCPVYLLLLIAVLTPVFAHNKLVVLLHFELRFINKFNVDVPK